MKTKFYILILAGLTSFIFGCKTANKLYQKGNYDEAVELAVKKLHKNAENNEMKALLQNAYRYAVEDHESRIASLANNNNELKWEWIYNEYSSLQRLYDVIRSSPEATSIIQPANYASFITTYKDKAGDVHNERGIKWMQLNNKESFKKAYREFQTALRFKPGNVDIEQKLNEAYELAIIHVVILPVNRFGTYQHTSYQLSHFESALIRNLQHHTNNQFVKFYSGRDPLNRPVDQVIELRFNSIDIGRIQDDRNTREVSKEVVLKEIVYKPDSIVKEYGKVYATITKTCRTVISNGNLKVSIRDANGGWLWNDDIHGDHRWVSEFSNYTGDARALNEEDKREMNRREEYPPEENEILESITSEINNKLLNRIREYYNR